MFLETVSKHLGSRVGLGTLNTVLQKQYEEMPERQKIILSNFYMHGFISSLPPPPPPPPPPHTHTHTHTHTKNNFFLALGFVVYLNMHITKKWAW